MIFTEKGTTKISGNVDEIMADLNMLLTHLSFLMLKHGFTIEEVSDLLANVFADGVSDGYKAYMDKADKQIIDKVAFVKQIFERGVDDGK